MHKCGHRFRQAEESGSTRKQERAQRRTSFSGLGRTQGSAEAGHRRLLEVTGKSLLGKKKTYRSRRRGRDTNLLKEAHTDLTERETRNGQQENLNPDPETRHGLSGRTERNRGTRPERN